MTFCFLRGPLRCEGKKEPILQSLNDVAEKPKSKDVFYTTGPVLSEKDVRATNSDSSVGMMRLNEQKSIFKGL